MKKIKILLFIIGQLALIGICGFLLYQELADNDILYTLNQQPSLYILISICMLSLISIAFNLEKLLTLRKKSMIYNFTRVGDLIFSIYFFILALITTYRINISFRQAEVTDEDIEAKIFGYAIIFFMYLLSIFLFIDNLMFHKTFKKMELSESIDHIGKREDQIDTRF